MENDLISRSALKRYVNDQSTHWLNEWSTIGVLTAIDKTPAVDAVEVVRCKECEHWHEEIGWCNQHSHFVASDGSACHPWESSDWKMLNADDYCSYGERRTENVAD